MTSESKYECMHEEQLQNHSLEIKELQTEVKFKKEKIDQLQDAMEKIDKKLDKIIERSEQKDSDIDKRVTSLETTVKVLKWVLGFLFGSGILYVIVSH